MSVDETNAAHHVMRGYDGPEGVQDQILLAKELACSNMLPEAYTSRYQNVLWAMWKAKALNIPLDTCMEQVGKLKGKTCVSNSLMLALMRRGGLKIEPVERNEKVVRLKVTRPEPDAQPEEYSFTFTEAEKMGLTKDKKSKSGGTVKSQYSMQPETMLFWRAVSKAARQAGSDVTNGLSIYTFDEMRAVPDEQEEQYESAADVVKAEIPVILGKIDAIMAEHPWDQSTSDRMHALYLSAKETFGMDTIEARDGMTVLEIITECGHRIIGHLNKVTENVDTEEPQQWQEAISACTSIEDIEKVQRDLAEVDMLGAYKPALKAKMAELATTDTASVTA